MNDPQPQEKPPEIGQPHVPHGEPKKTREDEKRVEPEPPPKQQSGDAGP